MCPPPLLILALLLALSVEHARASEPGAVVRIAADGTVGAQPLSDEPIDDRNRPAGVTLPRSANSHAVVVADYPPESIAAREEGCTFVRLLVLSDGTVGATAVERSSGYQRIDAAALKIVSRFLYYPALRDGKPVSMWIHAQIALLLYGSSRCPPLGR